MKIISDPIYETTYCLFETVHQIFPILIWAITNCVSALNAQWDECVYCWKEVRPECARPMTFCRRAGAWRRLRLRRGGADGWPSSSQRCCSLLGPPRSCASAGGRTPSPQTSSASAQSTPPFCGSAAAPAPTQHTLHHPQTESSTIQLHSQIITVLHSALSHNVPFKAQEGTEIVLSRNLKAWFTTLMKSFSPKKQLEQIKRWQGYKGSHNLPFIEGIIQISQEILATYK